MPSEAERISIEGGIKGCWVLGGWPEGDSRFFFSASIWPVPRAQPPSSP
jgi:hypothetical protein